MKRNPKPTQACLDRRRFLVSGAALTLSGAMFPAFAASGDYPGKPVRIVAGFPPGGSADLVARLAAQELGTVYKQAFVVENRAGAGGTIGAGYVAKSAPDGYTILLGVTASQTIAPAIYPTLPYAPAKDFTPIAMIATIPVALVVHPSLEARSAADLVKLAKASKMPLAFASSGNGAIPHLTGELFQESQGIKLEHIPFKGATPALSDVLAGRVPIMFDHLPSVLPHIRAGKLRVLGIAGSKRAKALPEVPTLAEQGIAHVVVRSWFGALAPNGTPASIVTSLSQNILKTMGTADIGAKLDAMGAEFTPAGPAEFEKIIREDTAMWSRIVKATSAAAS